MSDWSSRGSAVTKFNTGGSGSEASAHHWLVRDADANLLAEDGYDNVYMADVGSSAYQRAWLRNVLVLHSTGIRGVFIDDVLADPNGWTIGHSGAAGSGSSRWLRGREWISSA